MNDKEYEIQKNRVRNLEDKWISPLGLNWWKITVVYDREQARDKPKVEEHLVDVDGFWECVFATRSDYYYGTAHITAYLPIIQNIKDEDLERYFVHELIHIFVCPMRNDTHLKEEELVCTRLADAFLWAVKDKNLIK